MTLDQHPIWETVRDRIKVEWRGDDDAHDPRLVRGLELPLRGLDSTAIRRILETQIPCVACSRVICPFRVRKGMSDRMTLPREVFVSATCPTAINMGCNRTKAARAEQRRLVAVLQ